MRAFNGQKLRELRISSQSDDPAHLQTFISSLSSVTSLELLSSVALFTALPVTCLTALTSWETPSSVNVTSLPDTILLRLVSLPRLTKLRGKCRDPGESVISHLLADVTFSGPRWSDLERLKALTSLKLLPTYGCMPSHVSLPNLRRLILGKKSAMFPVKEAFLLASTLICLNRQLEKVRLLVNVEHDEVGWVMQSWRSLQDLACTKGVRQLLMVVEMGSVDGVAPVVAPTDSTYHGWLEADLCCI